MNIYNLFNRLEKRVRLVRNQESGLYKLEGDFEFVRAQYNNDELISIEPEGCLSMKRQDAVFVHGLHNEAHIIADMTCDNSIFLLTINVITLRPEEITQLNLQTVNARNEHFYSFNTVVNDEDGPVRLTVRPHGSIGNIMYDEAGPVVSNSRRLFEIREDIAAPFTPFPASIPEPESNPVLEAVQPEAAQANEASNENPNISNYRVRVDSGYTNLVWDQINSRWNELSERALRQSREASERRAEILRAASEAYTNLDTP